MRAPAIAIAVVLVACAREPSGTGEGTTGGSTGDDTGTETSSSSTSDGSAEGSSSGAGTSSSSSGVPPGSTTSGEFCTVIDECIAASDCRLPRSECIDCTCVGGVGCLRWAGEGAWGSCLVDGMADTSACEHEAALCLPDGEAPPAGATCVFPGCDEPCDCPAPPRGFEAQVACGDVANNGGNVRECYLSCERGQACPSGWSCAMDLYCVLPGLVTLPPWAACEDGGLCPATDGGDAGVCFDLVMGSVCSTDGCADAADCGDAPGTGMAPPTCADITGDAIPECVLDCSDGRACPDGMLCELDTLCVWP